MKLAFWPRLWPRLGLAVLLAVTAGQAAALSCRKPDARASYARAAAAEESYIVVHGVFSFDARHLPADGQARPPKPIAAQFAGKLLTRNGFTNPISVPVTLDVTCAGPWCGMITPQVQQLAFVERRADGYHLAVGPCPSTVFGNPDRATLHQMVACLKGGC